MEGLARRFHKQESMSAGLVEWQDLDGFRGGRRAPTKGKMVHRRQKYKVCSKNIVLKGPHPRVRQLCTANINGSYTGNRNESWADRDSIRSSGECGKLEKMSPEETQQRTRHSCLLCLFEMCSVLQDSPSFQEKLKLSQFLKVGQFLKIS